MIAHLFRGPHSIYRRYQGFLESSATAIGFATLVTIALNSLAAYPYNWVLVIGTAIAILGIRWPAIAYILAVIVMVYPIYILNLYLAVLFLAVSTLGHRLFIHFLGATILVLATPLLAEYHLHWLVPVLGGLWWGAIAGAWVGGLAALWGKVIGGMSGLDIDWLVLAGQAPDLAVIAARFQDANSLETLLLLIEPFAATSSVILYNLLQVIGWAIAAGFVGSFAGRKWVKYRVPWSILVVTAGGGLIMLATHIGLPYWLQDSVAETTELASPGLVSQDPVAPLFSLLVVIIVGTTIYTLRESLDLPVAPRRNFWAVRQRNKVKKAAKVQPFNFFRHLPGRLAKRSPVQTNAQQEEQTTNDDLNVDRHRRPVRVPNQSELPEWEPPKDDRGLIMLEID
jgi:hypothetical protein